MLSLLRRHISPSSSELRQWTPQIVEALLGMPAWMRLDAAEAKRLARYMQVQRIAAGTVFIRQDDPTRVDGLLLLLDGDVGVERSVTPSSDGLVVSLARPGALLGEMGLLNDAPPSASCVANSDVVVALLRREALAQVVRERPLIGAKLALGIASRLAEKLRTTSSKLSTLSQVTAAMHPSLETPRRAPPH